MSTRQRDIDNKKKKEFASFLPFLLRVMLKVTGAIPAVRCSKFVAQASHNLIVVCLAQIVPPRSRTPTYQCRYLKARLAPQRSDKELILQSQSDSFQKVRCAHATIIAMM